MAYTAEIVIMQFPYEMYAFSVQLFLFAFSGFNVAWLWL